MKGRQPKTLQSKSSNREKSLPTTLSAGGFCLEREFGTERRWVNWKYDHVDGKLTKVPYGKGERKAKSNDASTWMTYSEAKKASENIGIMALPNKKTLLVDFDNCLEPLGMISCSMEKEIVEFVKKSDTYTEISPSGKGLHLFFKLTEPLDLIVKKHIVKDDEKIECYTTGRYFTVTNKTFEKEKPVRTITKEEAIALLSILGYPWDKNRIESMTAPTATAIAPSSDSTLLDKMFSSKNGKKIKALYDGDTSGYDSDDSAADMALLNHLAFWTQKDGQSMQALWLASPLGQRKKTQTRKDYRVRTIHAAIANCKETYTPSPAAEQSVVDGTPMGEKIKIDFLVHKVGKDSIIVTQNTENIVRVLRHHPEFKNTIRMESFEVRVEVKLEEKWKPIDDSDIVRIQCRIATIYPCFQTVTSKMVWDAMVFIAEENRYDSAAEWLKSLTWDKVPRLDTWLTRTYGAPDNIYHRAVGSNWMKGLVARLVYPGCKFDHVLVIEGPQGTKKSTSLGILGGKWHLETTMATDNKDFFMQFAGKAIIEFSEGETFSRTEVKRLKAIITMQFDKYRPPYGRTSQDFPRRCVFAMTTNENEYLKDDTGNRRWLPVTLVLEEANVEWLTANRDQIFAEAFYRVTTLKESMHEFPREEMLAEQAKRKVQDPNTDIIVDWYWTELSIGDRVGGITTAQVYKVISGGYIHKEMSKTQEMNIAVVLRDALNLTRKRVMIGGSRAWRWYRPDGEPDPMEGKEVSVLEKLKRAY